MNDEKAGQDTSPPGSSTDSSPTPSLPPLPDLPSNTTSIPTTSPAGQQTETTSVKLTGLTRWSIKRFLKKAGRQLKAARKQSSSNKTAKEDSKIRAKLIKNLLEFQADGFSITNDEDKEYEKEDYDAMDTVELMLIFEEMLAYLQTIITEK